MLKVLCDLKERAKTTEEMPQQILATTLSNVHENVVCQLPSKDTIRRMVRRVRNEAGVPAIPRDIENLVIPPEFRTIKINDQECQFLKYDSEQTILPGRMLIFSTATNLNILTRSHKWYADGTFSVTPNLFYQLYTIHAEHGGTIIPLVYAVLPNKTKATYMKLLEELENMCPGLRPTHLLVDFEIAAIQAFKDRYHEIEISGCFYHLAQNVWRKVQSQGLQVYYTFAIFIIIDIHNHT